MSMNLKPDSAIYFIGIGGIAMSAVAGIAKEMELEVLGSDSKAVYDPALAILKKYSIPYVVGYNASNIPQVADVIFVASAGEDESNPEIAYLREHGIPIFSFAELLYELAGDKLRVVVTGTHGKSTTAGMLGRVLQEIDDSSFMTGAVLQGDETNFHVGDGHYFVFEGDEYKALYDDPTPKFHLYKPDITLLTNLEFDHPDVFSSVEELEQEFAELIANMPHDGLLVYNADNIALERLAHQTNVGQISYSLHNKADFIASNLNINPFDTSFTVTRTAHKDREGYQEQYKIRLFGEMNVYNALGVIATLRTLGFTREAIQDGLDEYAGVKRRLEFIGEKNGVLVFDDYAHHPTAVSETLKALKERFPTRRLWAVFEPHTFSRTTAVLPDLAKAFASADVALIAEIYPAREHRTTQTITGEQVVSAISEFHSNVRLVADAEKALEILKKELQPEDVVVVMAVGDFNKLRYQLI